MKLASFETITEILPIDGADRIELARIQGWQSVIRKNEYKVGDKIIFVPIDTVMQPREWNKFLWDKNDPTKPIRIKTMRMKGVISQGVIFPSSLVNSQDENVSIPDILGITKYEKPISVQLQGVAKGDFPSYLISKTDEDNLCSNIAVLEELKECESLLITKKLDGTSVTFIKKDNEFKVCSRNLELKDGDNVYWNISRKYDIVNIIPNNTSIQGEICGPSIQGNPMKLKDIELFIFNYKNLNTNEYLELDLNLPQVPVCWKITKHDNLTLEMLQELANAEKYGDQPAEGIVIRGYKNGKLAYSKTLQKMLSVKIINQYYKD